MVPWAYCASACAAGMCSTISAMHEAEADVILVYFVHIHAIICLAVWVLLRETQRQVCYADVWPEAEASGRLLAGKAV